MSEISNLGKITGNACRNEKQAIFGTVGRGLDMALKGYAKLLGRGLAAKSPLTKILAGAGGVASLGAANEGLAAGGLPHFKLDGDPMWSPDLAGVRRVNAGMDGMLPLLSNFFKRPIQSIFGNQNANIDPRQALGNVDSLQGLINKFKFGPNGEMLVEGRGTIKAPMAQSYIDYIRKLNSGPKFDNTPNNIQGSPPQQIRYIYGAPGLPYSSTI